MVIWKLKQKLHDIMRKADKYMRKKKVMALIMAMVMALGLTACGGGADSTKDNSGSGSETSSDEGGSSDDKDSSGGGEASGSGEGLKVGLITDVGGVNDGSFNQSSWEGLQRAMDELGIEGNLY